MQCVTLLLIQVDTGLQELYPPLLVLGIHCNVMGVKRHIIPVDLPESESINRPIANMATISPKRGFSVATVARVWLPVLTCAVAGKTAASQASFPLNSTKISHFSPLKEVSIWYVRFEYCFSVLN